jgi:thymidylate synthase ThyX
MSAELSLPLPVPSPEVRIDPDVRRILDEYKALGGKFQAPPEILLQLISATPDGQVALVHDVVASTAYQCYNKGVSPIQPRSGERAQQVVDSTLDAGHHTTRLHTSYTWHLKGVTRSAIHDVFHDNPFYNSEQQSQRYAEAKEGEYLIPEHLTPEQQGAYLELAGRMNTAYFNLIELLTPILLERTRKMYPNQKFKVETTEQRLDSKAKKLAQEIARYVLPIGQKTTLHHTLSTLQLARLFHASKMPHFTDESRYVIAQMIETIAELDPTIYAELRVPADVPIRPETDLAIRAEYADQFDAELDGSLSQLMASTEDPRAVLADAIRNALQISQSAMSDEDALRLGLDPAKNGLQTSVFDIGMLDTLTAATRMVSFTFKSRMSHSADSQRQRHRRTPGTTPSIADAYTGRPDYETPMVIKETPEIAEEYHALMADIYAGVARLLEMGVPSEYALMLLPNAQTVRIVESGDFFDWIHRFKQRLCVLAQEEIFFATVQQARRVLALFPEGKDLLLAPCGINRAGGVRPKCPEGERWCGLSWWQKALADYVEGRLV